jgi:4-amino-4-deoxy-L-arabinose transferase-like glycosyltransferase
VRISGGRAALAAALVLLFAGLSFWEMSGDSLTSDERVHLPAGYAYWKAREFRLNPEHPPLVKLLAAAPLLLLDARMPPAQPPPGGNYADYQVSFGSTFLFSQDADRLLFWGRLPVFLLATLLPVTMFLWSREIHGDGGGLLTLGLAALEPATLAHSHYVTTDAPLACFGLASMYLLWRFRRGGRLADLGGAAVSMGLALASKFSAVFLAALFVALLLSGWPAAGATFRGRRALGAGARARLAALAGAAALMALIVQASYLFSSDLSLYFHGLEAFRTNRPAFNPAYVFGRFFEPPVYWHPLLTFLLKTPLPTLALIGIGAAAAVVDRRRGGRRLPAELWLPPAVLFVATSLFSYRYGVRYLIPCTVFLLVLAGRASRTLASRPAGRAAGALLGAWLVLSVGHAAPDFLSYFNEAAGGPANGPYVMNDSNLDWGQDLKRFAAWQKARRVDDVVLAAWGPTPPEACGIRYRPWTRAAAEAAEPPPGLYAISVNHLVNQKRRVLLTGASPNLDWLARFRPVGRVGGSILLFRFPPPAR